MLKTLCEYIAKTGDECRRELDAIIDGQRRATDFPGTLATVRHYAPYYLYNVGKRADRRKSNQGGHIHNYSFLFRLFR